MAQNAVRDVPGEDRRGGRGGCVRGVADGHERYGIVARGYVGGVVGRGVVEDYSAFQWDGGRH